MNAADIINACTHTLLKVQKLASEQLEEGEDAEDRLDTINDKISDALYELRRDYGVTIEREE